MVMEAIQNALSGVGQTAMDVGRNVGQTAMGLAGLNQQPTNQRPSLYGDISQGDRFRALGAAVGGRLPQFEQQLMQENQMRQAQGMQSLQMREALAKTIAQDAQAGLLMAQSGDTQGFIDLIQDRIQLERQMGMDSTESENTLRDFQTGGFGAVLDDLQRAVAMGYTSGYLERPVMSEEDKLRYEREQKDWDAARGSIKTTMDNNNKLAADAVTGFNKLESLAGFIKKAQLENSSDQDKRAGRQAAATVLTIMARMASPGIVTDRDFANQAGGQSVYAGIMNFLREKGEEDLEIASLLANYDPTNPGLINVDALVGQAKGLIVGQAPSVLSTYASQKAKAQEYNPSNQYMSAEFGSRAARNVRDLIDISYGSDFNQKEFFDNPNSYLDQQQRSPVTIRLDPVESSGSSTSQNNVTFETMEEAIQADNDGLIPEGAEVFLKNTQTGDYDSIEFYYEG